MKNQSKTRILASLATTCVALGLAASPALADDPRLALLSPAQITLPAAQPNCDSAQLYTFNYPGDGSLVVVDAPVSGLTSPSNLVGINVWDSTSGSAPAQRGAAGASGGGVPDAALNYSSNVAGPVTLEAFNWSQTPVTISLAPIQMPAGTSLQAVSTKSAGAC